MKSTIPVSLAALGAGAAIAGCGKSPPNDPVDVNYSGGDSTMISDKQHVAIGVDVRTR